jgi:hypothetical protein
MNSYSGPPATLGSTAASASVPSYDHIHGLKSRVGLGFTKKDLH